MLVKPAAGRPSTRQSGTMAARVRKLSVSGLTRTGSLTKARSKAQIDTTRRNELTASLQQYLLQLPGSMDVEALKGTIAEAEAADCGAEILERSRNKLKDVEKVQARKREQERLAALELRREECSKALATLLATARGAPLLSVNVPELRAVVAEADALSTENGPGEVKAEAAAEARELLAAAEVAWEARRAEKAEQLEAASTTLAAVETEKLRSACTEAEVAGVAQDRLAKAHALLGAAVKRDAALNKLNRLADAPALDVELETLRKAWSAAVTAGVSGSDLKVGAAKARQIELAQGPRTLAAMRLERLVEAEVATLDTAAL